MIGAMYNTKKELQARIGKELRYIETSFLWEEYTENGTFCVVGPSPDCRKWYAQVTMWDGLIYKVK